MERMTSRHKRALILSALVFLLGFAVMVVYIFGFARHRHIAMVLEQSLMSFSCAFCFCLSAVALYYVSRVMEGVIAIAQVVLPIVSLMISVFISLHMVSLAMESLGTWGQEVLRIESHDMLDHMTVIHPSVESMVNFILIAVAAILAMTGAGCSRERIYLIGKVIILVSVIGLLDQFSNLSHFIGLAHKPIGLMSSLMFIVLGAELMTICRSK